MSKKLNKRRKREGTEDWEHVPAFLSKSQREDPINCIRWFCNWGSLYSMRIQLHELFRAAMGSPIWKDDDPDHKSDKIWFVDELMDLVESAYLLEEMMEEGKITFTINSKEE